MRIISGTLKSRTIIAPKGTATRPTSDRARESVFNVLVHNFDIEGTNVLDLFAGSGAFGFEALSRGAEHVTMVEKDRHAIAAIKSNAKSFDVEEQVTLATADVYAWLMDAQGSYDIIFADAPYDDPKLLEELPKRIFSCGLFLQKTLVIVEHRTGSRLIVPKQATIVRELPAGEAYFTILQTETQKE